MDEVWKPVNGYEGAYEISNLGRVRSLDRIIPRPGQAPERHKGRVLTPIRKTTGYLRVTLREGNRASQATIHSLVAQAFIGPRPSGADILHLDDDRTNNRLDNLRYGTRSENNIQIMEHGRKIGRAKLTLQDVDDIRRRLEQGESGYCISKDYGVHSCTIYRIRDGKTYGWYEGGEADAGEPCASKPICI